MATDTDTFTFHRSFPLSPERLWPLLTDVNMRAAWGAPGDHVLEVLSTDTRVGGVERQRCGPADNPEFEVETRWFRLDGPSDAVFTEQIEAGGMVLGASLVTQHIAATKTGSALSIAVAVSSFVGPEMMAEFRAGWEGSLVNLDALAAQQASGATN